LGLIVLTLLRAQAMADLPPLIPLRDFFRNPAEAGHTISPNGEYLGFMRPWNSRMNVYVQKIGEDEVVQITSVTERDVAGFFWANDNRIVYALDQGGDENFH